MASLQQIQSRRKAVKNVGQITKAMEVVATTKMRKSQEVALRTRPYAHKILELMERMERFAPITSPLEQHRDVQKTVVLIMTSDRGLIGSFNAQVGRFADEFFAKDDLKDKEGHSYVTVTVGKKAKQYADKAGLEVVEHFQGFGDFVDPSEVKPLSDLLIQGFLDKKWDRVITISTHFRTTLKQEVMRRDLLPLDVTAVRQTLKELVPEHGLFSGQNSEDKSTRDTRYEIQDTKDTYIFEPSASQALTALMPHLVNMEMYHLVLEANASEHSARRVAMKTASDNASDLSGTLTLEFNKVRKANITKSIIEITSTQTALQ